MAETTIDSPRKTRLVFCTSRPSRYAAVLNTLRQTFAIVLTDSGPTASDAIETAPEVVIIEDQLVGGDGTWLAQQARMVRKGKSGTIIMVGPKETSAIGRLLEERVVDAAITGNLSPGEFLERFWRIYGTRSEDEHVIAISKPAARVMNTNRKLFTRLEDMVAEGGIDREGRKAVTAAADSVVDLAGDPSVAPMLHQLRGHHDSTFAHSLRVGILMASFGRAIGVPDDQLRLMAETGLLHDLGKMKIPLSILAKPGKLTEEERGEMNLHPVFGAQLVNDGYRDLPDLIAAVRHHHEKLDGSGYPDGQTRGQIHEMSLCTAVVDVFSALTDRRDYKPAMARDQAFSIMDSMVGRHLEPRLYRRFRDLVIDTRLADEPKR
ncbi:MAG: HD domain-containing protein [Thalassobaculaceae bacterium]|nr:HD domain-containing protein [Thalassobaculaceae bacterium]